MKNAKLFLFIMLIVALYSLSYNKSSMDKEQKLTDDEFYLSFSMGDIQAFNSFKSGKDISIKVGLTYKGEFYDVKIINASKDNRLAFALNIVENFKIYDRQAYELIFMEDNKENSHSKLGICSPESYRVKLIVNSMDYGVFLMKPSYEDSILEESECSSIQENSSTKKNENLLKSLKIGTTKAQVDHDNKVIFVSLEKGTDTLQKISYKFENYHTDVFINSLDNDRGFEWLKLDDGKEYDFKGYIYKGKLSYINNDNRNIYDIYITTGDTPLIEISTENKTGEVAKIDIKDKVPCNIRFLSNMNEEYTNKIIKSGIEISGKTLNDKKNYSIKMDRKYKIDGMPAAKKWILDGNALDISLMRKKLTYDILKQIYKSDDISINIPEVRYVEVILNGQYQGLYTISNKIDEDFLNLDNYQTFKKYNDLLYKSVNSNGEFIPENLDRSIYGKEYEDFPDGLQPRSKDSDSIYGWHSGYEQKWPDINEYGQHWGPLEALIKTIAVSPQEEFNNIFSLVDREKFIHLWIAMMLQNNLNGTDNGQFMIRDDEKQVKWFFIPWETNPVFGMDKEMNKVEWSSFTPDYLFDRCMRINSFNKDFVYKWNNLVIREVIAVENYHNLIESYLEEIEDSQKRNYERWTIYEDKSFYNEVEYIKTWIEGRINWLDTYFNGEELNEE